MRGCGCRKRSVPRQGSGTQQKPRVLLASGNLDLRQLGGPPRTDRVAGWGAVAMQGQVPEQRAGPHTLDLVSIHQAHGTFSKRPGGQGPGRGCPEGVPSVVDT